jgi:hypothetical protein
LDVQLAVLLVRVHTPCEPLALLQDLSSVACPLTPFPGKDGKTKFAIENASRTRIVLADQKIHILGGFKNIHIARESIVSLILGQQPSKMYGNLRTIAGRMKERF